MRRSIGVAATSYSNFSVRGVANSIAAGSNTSRPAFGSSTGFGSSAASLNGVSMRGASNGAAAGSNTSRPMFGSSINLVPSATSVSNFSVRGAASALPSPSLNSRPTFGRQSSVGSTTSGSNRMLTGYGHYSAQGVPAFPGVHGGPNISAISGTQRRTPSTWSWTSNRM